MSSQTFQIVVLSLLLSASLRPASAAAPTDFTVDDYAGLIHAYLQGRRVPAARSLSQVPREPLQRAAEEYMKRWLVEAQIKGAVLLHTEVLMRHGRDVPGAETSFHLQTARRWLRQIKKGQASFERRWYLSLGYYYMNALREAEARPALEAALNVFPDDMEILLANGTLNETAGWITDNSASLEEAERSYRKILRMESEHAEARVRLGRVLQLRGKTEEAIPELQRGMEQTDSPRLKLAALLTLGDIHREAGELSQAIRSYRAATEIGPECQSAGIALAHALHLSGDISGSYQVIHEFLQAEKNHRTSRRSYGGQRHDMWWQYLLGHADRFDSTLLALRAELKP